MLTKPPRRSRPPAAPSGQRPPPATAPGAVRIIGGELRGSKLPVPEHAGLRPTPDRVRETLYNWLRPMLPGAAVLDLFAGSGALGIEAISQGAATADFVESDRRLADQLKTQLERLKVLDRGKLHCMSAQSFLQSTSPPGFDLILLDPPYALGLWTICLQLISERQLLKPHGLVYLEWPRGHTEPVLPPGFVWHKRSHAAGVAFGLLAGTLASTPVTSIQSEE